MRCELIGRKDELAERSLIRRGVVIGIENIDGKAPVDLDRSGFLFLVEVNATSEPANAWLVWLM